MKNTKKSLTVEKIFETENCFQNIDKVNINGYIFLIFKDSHVKNTKKSLSVEKFLKQKIVFKILTKSTLMARLIFKDNHEINYE